MNLGNHPANLFLRFALEVLALIAIGSWAAEWANGMMGIAAAFLVPLAIMVVWSVFAVPNDPSRSGKAPVPISGKLRLFGEFSFFGFASFSLYQVGFTWAAVIFFGVTLFHYCISFDRIKWLWNQ